MALTDNPWLPGNVSNDGETPPWSEIIRRWVNAKAADLHVAMPCVVVNKKTPNRVDLQPLLMEKFKYAPAALPLPVIQDALVCTPRGATWLINLPIAVGDTGLAVFTDRSIDVWSASAGVVPVDPVDTRRHDLSDAVFIPGLYPFTEPPVASPDAGPLDLTVRNGLAQLVLQPSGRLFLGNAVVDLLTALQVFASACSSSSTDPVLAAAAAVLDTALTALVGVPGV